MDPNTKSFTEEMRKQIYEKLADDLIAGLEKGEMTTNDSEESSEFILSELEKATTKEDALLFLQALATRWPSYQNAYLWIRKEILQAQDQQQAQDVAEKIQKIASAL